MMEDGILDDADKMNGYPRDSPGLSMIREAAM
jgi:hypothetical protein